jgi:phosphoribosylanthranilate isomerase
MHVKICGITRLEDALLSIEYGAWAIGFNFYTKSSRYISPYSVLKIIKQLPKDIVTIGVFVNTPSRVLSEMLDYMQLDFAQVYTPMRLITHHSLILSLNLNTLSQLPDKKILSSYYAILLDAPILSNGLLGGTGRLANWAVAKKLAKKYKLILAGGLTPLNLKQAITQVQPFAVDVASGIEDYPGIKNPSMLKKFLLGAKHGK